jgi:hypothetical protein
MCTYTYYRGLFIMLLNFFRNRKQRKIAEAKQARFNNLQASIQDAFLTIKGLDMHTYRPQIELVCELVRSTIPALVYISEDTGFDNSHYKTWKKKAYEKFFELCIRDLEHLKTQLEMAERTAVIKVCRKLLPEIKQLANLKSIKHFPVFNKKLIQLHREIESLYNYGTLSAMEEMVEAFEQDQFLKLPDVTRVDFMNLLKSKMIQPAREYLYKKMVIIKEIVDKFLANNTMAELGFTKFRHKLRDVIHTIDGPIAVMM